MRILAVLLLVGCVHEPYVPDKPAATCPADVESWMPCRDLASGKLRFHGSASCHYCNVGPCFLEGARYCEDPQYGFCGDPDCEVSNGNFGKASKAK